MSPKLLFTWLTSYFIVEEGDSMLMVASRPDSVARMRKSSSTVWSGSSDASEVAGIVVLFSNLAIWDSNVFGYSLVKQIQMLIICTSLAAAVS